ncbi:MAG TPA: SDR family oxidoreductase [Candidatus Kapabacteria bacterium]|nr:SDR family oxidoreductase [Candidatus Kapabacteria bacterium]
MKPLANKIALVTGASRGIGKAIAMRLAQDGALVMLHYFNSKELAGNTLDTVTREGGNAVLVHGDFSTSDGVKKLYEQTTLVLGGRPLDILINNAGSPERIGSAEITEEQFDHLFEVNLKAPFFLTQKFLDNFSLGGRIINISSQAARSPHHNIGPYAMTKAALDSFTVSMATLLGPRGITVNSIRPGPTLTDENQARYEDEKKRTEITNRTAMRGLGKSIDIAGMVSFLVSPDANWVTGQIIEVSGGFSI